jgi:hypothetical protein
VVRLLDSFSATSPVKHRPKKSSEFSLQPAEQISYKRVNVQPANAVIVNAERLNAPIEIGFAAP